MVLRYIRFGNIPDSGRSRNSMDASLEAGISCYRAIRCADGWRIDAAWGSYRMLSASNRPLYEIAGTLLDVKGADGEPLLSDAKIVRRCKIKIVGDMWKRLKCAAIGPAEAIWRHRISGEIWVALSGSLCEAIEFRCNFSDLPRNLKIMLPLRAEKILAGLIEAGEQDEN